MKKGKKKKKKTPETFADMSDVGADMIFKTPN